MVAGDRMMGAGFEAHRDVASIARQEPERARLAAIFDEPLPLRGRARHEVGRGDVGDAECPISSDGS